MELTRHTGLVAKGLHLSALAIGPRCRPEGLWVRRAWTSSPTCHHHRGSMWTGWVPWPAGQGVHMSPRLVWGFAASNPVLSPRRQPGPEEPPGNPRWPVPYVLGCRQSTQNPVHLRDWTVARGAGRCAGPGMEGGAETLLGQGPGHGHCSVAGLGMVQGPQPEARPTPDHQGWGRTQVDRLPRLMDRDTWSTTPDVS